MDLLAVAVHDERDGVRVPDRVGCELREALLLAAPVLIVGIGGLEAISDFGVGFSDGDDAVCVVEWQ